MMHLRAQKTRALVEESARVVSILYVRSQGTPDPVREECQSCEHTFCHILRCATIVL